MIIVGLTGGIASGKSTILKIIKKLKIPTHDSDAAVQELYKKRNINFISFLKKIGLSEAVEKKIINKKLIAMQIAKNKSKFLLLERFIHKEVKKSRQNFLKKNKNRKKKLVVLDVPLLFEKKINIICDWVILAYCPQNIRRNRALKRKGASKKFINQIFKIQMPDKIKKTKSHFIINTNKSKNYTFNKTLKVIEQIKSPKD